MQTIYVPVDNSSHSDAAVGMAVSLAARMNARCIGMHAYAGKMHDYRFKQMEYTLPEEYQDEAELLRQRRIHDSLITTGLQLISESYTDVMRYRCLEAGVPFEARMRDGRNFEEVLADIADVNPDLVIMGALGTGAVRRSKLGSVAERVIRRCRNDILLVRDQEGSVQGGIMVCIDGSPQSFGALLRAIELAEAFKLEVEAVAVYDPYLHYAVFNGIVDVLSEKASKIFRFKEQEALHEEIIDTGLAKIYESHLRVAQATAESRDVVMNITLLDGKPFDRIIKFADEKKPWLVACGRIGVHSDDTMDIGSTTDALIRELSCNVLITSGTFVPPIDVRAEMAVVWTPEAEDGMAYVPRAMRGMARTVVLRWAMERGHSVITRGDVAEALDEFMPQGRMMQAVARTAGTLRAAEQALIEEAPVEDTRSICPTCGYAARISEPVQCPVCGTAGEDFEKIDLSQLRLQAIREGDASETGFDGQKLGWTVDARRCLQQLPAGYLRRRVKAVIEKQARSLRLDAITAEFAEPWIKPEVEALDLAAGPHRAPLSAEHHTGGNVNQRKRLPWDRVAEDRIERIPSGFLRNLAVEQIERLAEKLGAVLITPLHVEAGIAEAKSRIAAASGDGSRGDSESAHAAADAPAAVSNPGLNEITAPVVNQLGRRATSKVDVVK